MGILHESILCCLAPSYYPSALGQASYCDVECQKLAWTVGNHKKLCRKWAQKKSEEQSPKLHDDDLLKKEKTTSMESQQSQGGDSSAVGDAELPTT